MSFLDKVVERREAVKAEMDAILEAVAAENRTDLTAEETEKVEALATESRSLDEKIEKLTAQADADKKAAEARAKVASVATPKASPTVVTREARTYTPESGNSFIMDAYRAQFKSDYSAQERLARHQREEEIERRDVGTGAFAGLVIPQYLVDLAAPLARAGRSFADFGTTKHTLPEAGMTLNISRGTTGSSAAAQDPQNNAVQETDMDDTLLTIDVITVAGQQDVSRQAIERGSGIDAFVVADLIRAWQTKLDQLILNGAGSSGEPTGLRGAGGNAVTFTSTAPTVALLYPKLADAIQQVQTNFYGNPTHWLMHPRRLAFLLASVDSSNRPLVVPAAGGPMNAVASGTGVAGYGNSGYQMLGLPIITDANITTTQGTGTNQDEIYCITAGENHLWEQPGSPFALRYDATGAGSLTIKTVVSQPRYYTKASISQIEERQSSKSRKDRN